MSEFSQQTVLIVDDNVDNLSVVVNTLNHLDLNILIAQTGEEAIKNAVKLQPDIILLDIMMPVIDGFEVCKRLKELDDTRHIPVIFLTAAGRTAEILNGFKLGAVDYINKPFIGEELIARVSTHLRTVKTTKELKELLKNSEIQNDGLIKLNKKIESRNKKIKSNIELLIKKNKIIETQANKMAGINQLLLITNRELDVKKAEIEYKNSEILSGLRYAQTIQSALLPSEEALNELFPEHFVFFKPKESVGGDFYFAAKHDQYKYFGVADCTGHGVPGAFLTMLGISFLTRSNYIDQNCSPAAVLNDLRDYIKRIFQNSESRSSGMDAMFCKLNAETRQLEYSGAFMSIYLVRNGTLIEYKGNKNPVGSFPIEHPFENCVIPVKENDILYLFSDGYIDQFGEKTDKKFMNKNFKELLLSVAYLPMKKQKEAIENRFDQWKGKTEQTDDVLVVGIKINAEQ